MGATAGIMMAGSAISGGIQGSEAARAQGDYQRSQSYLNASLSETAAADAIDRGRKEANISRRKTNATAASQKVAAAAQGLDVGAGEGSPAETIESTRELGAVEEMNIKTNAWREAWGYKVQAINERTQGDIAAIAGRGEARQTLIAGGMEAVGYGAGAYDRIGRTPSRTTTTGTGSAQTAVVGNRRYIQPPR